MNPTTDQPTNDLAVRLGEQLRRLNHSVATVESCTGGGIARMITTVAGSSRWFERGFVTYSNDAKVEMVGVARELLERHGAVSVEVAAAMAEGGLRFSEADYCIAVTGVAGPDGGSAEKPVGTVCFAWAGLDLDGETRADQTHFYGDRFEIRAQCVLYALHGLLGLLGERANADDMHGE